VRSSITHSIYFRTAGLLPYYEIDSNAPFSVALGKFFPWASYVVSIGACAGTFNSAFADLYAMSRLMVVLSRCRLIPEFLVSWRLLHLLHDSYISVMIQTT
jgi:amino acid transporter